MPEQCNYAWLETGIGGSKLVYMYALYELAVTQQS